MGVNYTYNHFLITLLLPHRLPFLMVDTITFYQGGKIPSLHANYALTDREPLYSKDEADDHWPSMYIIEGLGQSCNLMIIISVLEKRLVEAGLKFNSIGEVLERLMNDEPDEITRVLKNALNQRLMEPYSSVGFVGSAEMEITGYARQGQVVYYETQLNQVFGSLYYSTVRAYTDNNLIARGTLVSASRMELSA
jgi:3-hydroxymyristoyl/3-hydroxydecanoyl-(acyl carrier protein) dehydratase